MKGLSVRESGIVAVDVVMFRDVNLWDGTRIPKDGIVLSRNRSTLSLATHSLAKDHSVKYLAPPGLTIAGKCTTRLATAASQSARWPGSKTIVCCLIVGTFHVD